MTVQSTIRDVWGQIVTLYEKHPSLIIIPITLVSVIIARRMIREFCKRDGQRTNTLVIGIGTPSRLLLSIGKIAMKIASIIPHPILWRVLGILSGTQMAVMPIVTSDGNIDRANKSVLRQTPVIHPKMDNRPVRTGIVDAKRLFPHLRKNQAIDHFNESVRILVPWINTLVVIGSVEGGTSGSLIAANIPGTIRNATGANNFITIIIETVPVEDEIRRGNIELCANHYFESALNTADLNIIVQQETDEIDEINAQLSPFIALIAGDEAQGDDVENLIERMGPGWSFIMDLGELPANSLKLRQRILETWKPLNDKMPNSIRKTFLTRTIGTPDKSMAFEGPKIEGKKISLLMFQPEEVNLLDEAKKAIQGITKTNLVASRAVEWRRNSCRIYLLVSLDENEMRQTYAGSFFPEGFNTKTRLEPEKLPIQAPVPQITTNSLNALDITQLEGDY